MAIEPRLASTVMLLRNIEGGTGVEVFMVRRVVQSEFMPNLYVFPGGSVSADDHLVETSGLCAEIGRVEADPEGRTALGSGVRAAAIRELFEEANILLAYREKSMLAVPKEAVERFAEYRLAFNQRRGSLVEVARKEELIFATDMLAYFAHWVTPEGMPKRFDTHFFLATAPGEQEALYDQLETSEGVWLRPAEALEGHKRGEIPIAFPTYHQLRDLAEFASVQEALDASKTRYIPRLQPVLAFKDGKPHRVYLEGDSEKSWSV